MNKTSVLRSSCKDQAPARNAVVSYKVSHLESLTGICHDEASATVLSISPLDHRRKLIHPADDFELPSQHSVWTRFVGLVGKDRQRRTSERRFDCPILPFRGKDRATGKNAKERKDETL